jgi:ubiquitin carboxyl-terminal hydrolase L5
VVNNACATLAIVNALGNIPELKVGDVLGNIFSFGVGMDPWVSRDFFFMVAVGQR